ncbi:MAG: LAGLIDADG family homing endonuclease [Parcubacteria group bacterium]|jgi:hypothetical protein
MSIFKKKNENFFKKWSPEMAYVLGFFAADGCMIKNNRGAHFIEFHITDRDIVVKIRKLLDSENKIAIRNRNTKWKIGYRLQIGSKIMFEDLLSLGMTPRKSNTLKFPKVPKKYFNHFARGYFDGDGNVYANEYRRKGRKKLSKTLLSGFTCGSEIFLKKMHREIKRLTKIIGGTLFVSRGCWHLYYSVNDSCKLYGFMYNNAGDLFLNRKKKVFKNYIEAMDR